MTDIDRLLDIMRRLRDPESGCPWDKEQSFETIAPYTLEEAYEVADAIARGDMDDLAGELGDLLFQVVYHAQIASEQGAFDFSDVLRNVSDKLVRRHPHVFGEKMTLEPGDWERQKAKERPTGSGVLDGIARSMPALRQASKLQSKAAAVGFDWPSIEPVVGKIREELEEVCEELKKKTRDAALAAELGDLLFATVNLCRHVNVDAEFALLRTNKRFRDRFAYIEAELRKAGRQPQDSSLEELDRLWDAAKKHESGCK